MKPDGLEIKAYAFAQTPLLPSALALVVGIAGGRLAQSFPYTTAVISTLLVLALLVCRRLSSAQRAAALVFFVFGLASFYVYGPGAPSPVADLVDKGPVRLTGEVVRPPEERKGYTILYLRPELTGRAGLIRMTVRGTRFGILYGDVLSGVFSLSVPTGFRNPGTFDWGAYVKLNGVDAAARVRPDELTRYGNRAGFLLGGVYGVRQELIHLADASLPRDASAIFRAMVLGDQGGVTQEMRDDFAASGTTHILSVSGSHLALFATLIFFMVRWSFFLVPRPYDLRLSLVFDYKKAAAGVTIAASGTYCLLAGSEAATVRSFIMIAVFMASILIERESDVFNTLSCAALITLLWSPDALFDISFQLSYGAVFFMALLLRGLKDGEPSERRTGLTVKARRYLGMTALMSCVAILGTAPLVAMNFNSFSYVALPANLIVVPIAGFMCVPAGLVSCLIYAFTHGASLPLSGLNTGLYEAYFSLVRLFATAPSANLHPSAPGMLISALYYVLFAAALIYNRLNVRLAAATVAFAAAFSVSGFMPVMHENKMKVVFFDVGQADSALVEFPDGRTMLIDCGGSAAGIDPGRSAVAPYLWNHGIRRLNYVVLTHPHPDHLYGLLYIFENFEVGQVWEGGGEGDSEGYTLFRSAVKSNCVPCYTLVGKGEVAVGGAEVQVLHTAYDKVDDYGRPKYHRCNNRSLVLRVKYKDTSFLFTGDVEHEAEDSMLAEVPPLPLGSTVMKVPHHGSRHSCGSAFLSAVSPGLAVIQVGRYNRYGFPNKETLDALQGTGARVLRTDEDGAVTVSTDGKELRVETYEDSVLKPASSWADESENLRKLFKL